MKKRFFTLLAAMLIAPLGAMARNYDVSLKNASAAQAIDQLREITQCDFVYQKELLKGADKKINGVYKNMSLTDLLDNVVVRQLGLSYRIVNNNIVLSKGEKVKGHKNVVAQGVVTDAAGDPLPGVTVKIDKSNIATMTNADGRFTISAPEGSTMSFTYIGMEPYVVKIAGKSTYDITLRESATALNEVVVTGYQNIKRENATGSYTILSGDELTNNLTTTLASSLEGKIPGLVRSRSNKYAKGENEFVIRGVGTFEARTAPLVVVDGLPIEGGLETVNPYDIENLTVLKDAAAASIYGARASNGVLVITTKQAKKEKVSIDFNTDITITERTDYSKAGICNAAQLIELERKNFGSMVANKDEGSLSTVLANYEMGRIQGMTPVTRLLIANHLGELSSADLNSTLSKWGQNDYLREYQALRERNRVNQQYNLALRVQGKSLASSIVANYSADNFGTPKEYENRLQLSYRGDLKLNSWMDLSLGINVLNNRERRHAQDNWGGATSFHPYRSMYNADGTPARLETNIFLSNPAFADPTYELVDPTYSPVEELGLNMSNSRSTNIRSFIHANFKLPVQGWTAGAMFQYEDVMYNNTDWFKKSSYYGREVYNLYTTCDLKDVWVDDPNWDFDDWDGDFDHIYKKKVQMNSTVHHVPSGDMLANSTSNSAFYTFRAQTNYKRTFLDLHQVDVIGGFEYRQTHTSTKQDVLIGYDHTTQTNKNVMTDWAFMNGWGKTGVLGSEYAAMGCPNTFGTSDTLHRYYSYYFTANYVYDSKYSVFGSYRVDNTDLFGTDPKFRSRPLWSAGLSWNMQNESFMQPYTWINMMKLRASYGLTGNIDSNATSYLTARIGTNGFNGRPEGTITTPPNDQLRWEKTATWNGGVDFAFMNYRLSGSLDFYHKNGSDLLGDVTLDCTTGWSNQKINAGCMTNRGVELQLYGRILEGKTSKDVDVNLGFNIGYNKSKVTKVLYKPSSSYDYRLFEFKEGYPMNALFSIDYAGLKEIDGTLYGIWRDKEGVEHNTSISGSDLKIEDLIYSGTQTPVWSGGIMPEVRWYGFSLSAMCNFYGGHVMCVPSMNFGEIGGSYGYGSVVPVSAFDYWNGKEGVLPNGYMTKHMNNTSIGNLDYRTVERADYMKLRNLSLGYDFDNRLSRRIGINNLRLRFQINDLATWARNSRGWDPEGWGMVSDVRMSSPTSYTMSLYFNL